MLWMLLDDAALALATPAGHILQRMPMQLRRRKDREIIGDFFEIAKVLRCPEGVAKAVASGTEWLMSDLDIERVYGCDDFERTRIAKVPVFTPAPYAPVWLVSPFIAWTGLTKRSKTLVLQGKMKHAIPQRRSLQG